MCLLHLLPNSYTIFSQEETAACIFTIMSRMWDEGFYVFNRKRPSWVKRILIVIFHRIRTKNEGAWWSYWLEYSVKFTMFLRSNPLSISLSANCQIIFLKKISSVSVSLIRSAYGFRFESVSKGIVNFSVK